MGRRHRHVTDEDDEEKLGGDDDDGDDDVYMYPADMHPDERHAYREAVRASKAAKWNRQQEKHFKNMKNLFKGDAIKETMGRLISKFFIYESVSPNKADPHHFKNMIVGAQQAGMGIEPSSPYEIKHKYLDMEYKDMEVYVNIQREKWKTYGCTIMSHCIDLMFEDIGKRKSIADVITKARKITNFIYNHSWLVAQMRKRVGKLVSIYEALYMVLRIVDSKVIPTMPFVYELIRVMKENLIRLNAKEWVLEIIAERWDRTLKHHLHTAVGTDPDLLQAVHEVFTKLDPTSESLSQFGNEIILFRYAKRGFGDQEAIASRSEMVPDEYYL
ncbi:hypothetical protein CK203_048882 [Vitis vinifera]|uniref:DUF659 domain-containing protein n=1 Tax=Vitis vinifera TaxID=29760 RepID=A0A438FL04_VITVI|nr:hypothetical protein CK203_048882 [Vitis vinifera]